jgi:hypothetical protein
LLAVVLLCWTSSASALERNQQPAPPPIAVPPEGETQELVLRDGTHAFGRVERVDADRVTFRTASGAMIDVDPAQIVTLRIAGGRVVNGEFRPADPNPTRLFFGPTARSLRQGTAYVGVYEIFLPFVQVGLTDRISIGAGTPLIFGSGSAHPFWVTPKVQVLASRSTQASLGVLHFMNVGDGSLGIAYGVVTQGSTDSALTAGIGYAYERSYDEKQGAAVVMIGGEHRVTRGMKLVTENYLWNGGGFAMGGVRWMGEHLSADLGLVVPLGADSVFVFPMVNFVWSISRD